MKKVILTALMGVGFFSYSQPFYKHFDVGLSFGSSHYSGEIANQSTFNTWMKEFKGQTGLQLNYLMSRNFSVGLEGVYGQWYANDVNHLNINERNFYGNSNYFYAGFNFKQRFFGKKGYRLRPYFGGGMGANFYTTKITGRVDAKHVPTKTQEKNSDVAAGFTGLVGVSYKLNSNFNIGLEAWLSLYGNDEIDNLVYAAHEADKIGSIRLTLNYKLQH